MGVAIRELHTAAEMADASRVMAAVWRTDVAMMEPGLLVALAHTDNYVAGAFDGDRMIGICVGFFHAPDERALHSHIAGVLPGSAGSGVGRALKEHQREWTLARGATRMTWTFDPLIARNAHFNIRRLGVRVIEYLPDLYGPMTDGLNRGEPSDRLFVEWDLSRPADLPPASTREPRMIPVPADIETLRVDDPSAARSARLALRDQLGPLLSTGWRVVDFADGAYVLDREPS